MIRENTRLKNEVRMLRQELGMKAVPDPMQPDSDDDFKSDFGSAAPQSVRSM